MWSPTGRRLTLLFTRASRCSLAVRAIEVGGRWSLEAARFVVRLLARRARSVPWTSRRHLCCCPAVVRAAFAVARAFAASLLSLPLAGTGNIDTYQPQPCTAEVDSAALRTAERRKAEPRRQGPQKF